MLLVTLLLLNAIVIVFMPWVLMGFAPGFSDNPEKFDLAIREGARAAGIEVVEIVHPGVGGRRPPGVPVVEVVTVGHRGRRRRAGTHLRG